VNLAKKVTLESRAPQDLLVVQEFGAKWDLLDPQDHLDYQDPQGLKAKKVLAVKVDHQDYQVHLVDQVLKVP